MEKDRVVVGVGVGAEAMLAGLSLSLPFNLLIYNAEVVGCVISTYFFNCIFFNCIYTGVQLMRAEVHWLRLSFFIVIDHLFLGSHTAFS